MGDGLFDVSITAMHEVVKIGLSYVFAVIHVQRGQDIMPLLEFSVACLEKE